MSFEPSKATRVFCRTCVDVESVIGAPTGLPFPSRRWPYTPAPMSAYVEPPGSSPRGVDPRRPAKPHPEPARRIHELQPLARLADERFARDVERDREVPRALGRARKRIRSARERNRRKVRVAILSPLPRSRPVLEEVTRPGARLRRGRPCSPFRSQGDQDPEHQRRPCERELRLLRAGEQRDRSRGAHEGNDLPSRHAEAA